MNRRIFRNATNSSVQKDVVSLQYTTETREYIDKLEVYNPKKHFALISSSSYTTVNSDFASERQKPLSDSNNVDGKLNHKQLETLPSEIDSLEQQQLRHRPNAIRCARQTVHCSMPSNNFHRGIQQLRDSRRKTAEMLRARRNLGIVPEDIQLLPYRDRLDITEESKRRVHFTTETDRELLSSYHKSKKDTNPRKCSVNRCSNNAIYNGNGDMRSSDCNVGRNICLSATAKAKVVDETIKPGNSLKSCDESKILKSSCNYSSTEKASNSLCKTTVNKSDKQNPVLDASPVHTANQLLVQSSTSKLFLSQIKSHSTNVFLLPPNKHRLAETSDVQTKLRKRDSDNSTVTSVSFVEFVLFIYFSTVFLY
uniref:Enkurin domain-containing protein n=1 Tax=Syphacia muris TaxID=451379 RepID=A0A0N5AYF9_9BILA